MRTTIMAAMALIAAPALAQTADNQSHEIDVTGHGKVSVAPDTANLHYWLRGEGKTPDEATNAMVASQKAVESGLKGFLGPQAKITNSNLIVIEVRDPKCDATRGQAVLSQGECAILGYLATAQTDVSTPAVDKAGTAVGLASRLGARDARLQSYEVQDTLKAQQAAMTDAVNDARQQAQVLASASGGHLGRVLRIQYGSYSGGAVIVTGERIGALPPAPPPPPPPPVEIDMKPRPQEITADVSVSYELLP